MHDTLNYISKDPIYRTLSPRRHDRSACIYAFSENFILPLSHDEVVHGKGSILGRMPGDDWQRFANLRAYYGFMFGASGQEAAVHGLRVRQEREWNHDHQPRLAPAADDPLHAGMQTLVRDLNRLYRERPGAARARLRAARASNGSSSDDTERSVFAWLRKGSEPERAASWWSTSRRRCGATTASGCRVGGTWREVLNTDAASTAAPMSGMPGGLWSPKPVELGRRRALLCRLCLPLAGLLSVPEV